MSSNLDVQKEDKHYYIYSTSKSLYKIYITETFFQIRRKFPKNVLFQNLKNNTKIKKYLKTFKTRFLRSDFDDFQNAKCKKDMFNKSSFQ